VPSIFVVIVSIARRVRWRVIAACVLLLTGLAAGGPSAQTARPLVYVVPIDGVIDLGLAPFLERPSDAEQAGAAAVGISKITRAMTAVFASIRGSYYDTTKSVVYQVR
jgi:hypothetical protein